jgi:moderate conductance mechanosensitive channel
VSPVSSLPLLLAAASPSPSPSETPTTPAVPTLEDAQESATNAASWVEENWSTWLAIGLRVLLILVIAAVLRVVVRRAITKLIDRMNRSVPATEGSTLGGLLVTWSAVASAPRPSARCCAPWRPS